MTGPALVKSDKNRKYSLSAFISRLADPTQKAGGYEIELSQEAARLSGKDSATPIVPWSVFMKAQDTVTAPSGGSDLGMSLATPANHADLFTVTDSAAFKASAAGQLQVPIYQAPLGAFKVPRQVSPIVPEWIARDAALPKSDARFDALDAVPHTLGAVTDINRSALIDTAPPMQNVIQDAIWAAVMSALDQALLGAAIPDAHQPTGLYNLLTGASDFSLITDPAELLAALAEIADKSDGGQQAMIASRRLQVWARTTALSASLTATPLLSDASGSLMDGLNQVWNGRMRDFDGTGTPAATPPAVNNHAMFGPFAQYLSTVLFGSGVELSVNPYGETNYQKGAIAVRCLVDADILCRDPDRFGKLFVAY